MSSLSTADAVKVLANFILNPRLLWWIFILNFGSQRNDLYSKDRHLEYKLFSHSRGTSLREGPFLDQPPRDTVAERLSCIANEFSRSEFST